MSGRRYNKEKLKLEYSIYAFRVRSLVRKAHGALCESCHTVMCRQVMRLRLNWSSWSKIYRDRNPKARYPTIRPLNLQIRLRQLIRC